MAAAQQRYPYVKKLTAGYDKEETPAKEPDRRPARITSYSDRGRFDNRNTRDKDRCNRRDRGDHWEPARRNYDRNRDRDRDRDKDRYRDRERNRSDRNDRDRNRRNNRNNSNDKRGDIAKGNRPRAHFAGENDTDDSATSESVSPASSDTESDAAYAITVIDRHLTCYKCHQLFLTVAKTRTHVRRCGKGVPEVVRTPSPLDPASRTYGYCRETLNSRNLLFRHLKICQWTKDGRVKPESAAGDADSQLDSETALLLSSSGVQSQLSIDDAYVTREAELPEGFTLREASSEKLVPADSNPLSSYQHFEDMAITLVPAVKGLYTDYPYRQPCF
ncbi:hypothetical protein V8F33_014132 [Rhypophila sp. PSN 637]